MNDKNINFYICLLPYYMRLCYASSGFFRNTARIQDIEVVRESRSLFESWLYSTGRDLGRLLTHFKPQFICQSTRKSIMPLGLL